MPEPAHDRPTPAAPSNLTQQLYTADGQARLPDNAIAATSARPPPGSLARDPHAEAEAKRLLERPDPIDYKPTRFDKDWASDGNLLDLATQQAGQALAGMFGKKHRDESRHARPPPDVRFNPALHERPEDLGSEATGDAYKAAPIAFEKVPDLKGGASRRIRAGIAELRSRRSGCGDTALDRWLSPVQAHLNELQKVEYKLAHGADPVSAEHLLPGLADSAYDLARRALWYADRKLSNCTPADRELAARVRMAQQAELYSYAAAELQTLASTPYDLPMSIDQAVEFAESSAAAQKPDKLPQEVLDALGIDETQLAVIDALEQQRAVQRATDLRQSIRDNREAILAEVNSFVDVSGAPNEVVSRLVADQHRALYEKVAAKLQARMAQLIGMRSRYSGALGEALLLTSDIKDVDKAYVEFVKKNQGEFRFAA